jgi:uncharacterized protein with PQ loop repeat
LQSEDREERIVLATTWGTGQVLLDMFWFVLFVIEIWLMFTIFVDIFRQHEMPGWLKAFWVLLVIIFPFIGILVYLILYGNKMRVHAQQDAAANESALLDYLRHAGGTHSPSEELARLAELRNQGVIDEEEFTQLKRRIVNG